MSRPGNCRVEWFHKYRMDDNNELLAGWQYNQTGNQRQKQLRGSYTTSKCQRRDHYTTCAPKGTDWQWKEEDHPALASLLPFQNLPQTFRLPCRVSKKLPYWLLVYFQIWFLNQKDDLIYTVAMCWWSLRHIFHMWPADQLKSANLPAASAFPRDFWILWECRVINQLNMMQEFPLYIALQSRPFPVQHVRSIVHRQWLQPSSVPRRNGTTTISYPMPCSIIALARIISAPPTQQLVVA